MGYRISSTLIVLILSATPIFRGDRSEFLRQMPFFKQTRFKPPLELKSLTALRSVNRHLMPGASSFKYLKVL